MMLRRDGVQKRGVWEERTLKVKGADCEKEGG